MPPQAFLWTPTDGVMVLGVAPHPCDEDPNYWRCGPIQSRVAGISADGSVIVGGNGVFNAEDTFAFPFRWTPESGIEVLGIWEQYALAVSADGRTIIGSGDIWTDETGWVPIVPYIRIPDDIVFPSHALAVSSDAGVIPGQNPKSSQAAIWSEGELRSVGPPALESSFATSVSASSRFVVGYGRYSGVVGDDVFRWTAEIGPEVLPRLNPSDLLLPSGLSVSDDGVVIGTVIGTGGSDVPTIWTRDGIPYVLSAYLESEFGLDLMGWRLEFAADITPDGHTIVGSGRDPDGEYASWIIRLPPPCPADFNHDGALTSADFFDFLGALLAGDSRADFNADARLNSQDLFDFLVAFFNGCP
jgi:hypothetical protein